MVALARRLGERLADGYRCWLFLDYDGTLAEFAPDPDTILPDEDLAVLLNRLAGFPDALRVVILSGRRLAHIENLVPLPGILLAGTYGIEYRDWAGRRESLVDLPSIRPVLEQVKLRWEHLLAGRSGFYLEDKGFAVAIHAKDAEPGEAGEVIRTAAKTAQQLAGNETLKIQDGGRFLEVAPLTADKGQSIRAILDRFPWPGAGVIVLGDDDKDESAFQAALDLDGLPVLVSARPRQSLALHRLQGPAAVRKWLIVMVDTLEQRKAQRPG